jgi:hypothetical protein
MKRFRWLIALGLALLVVVAGATRWPVRAQERPPVASTGGTNSLQDALLRPCNIPFANDTTLDAVAQYLRKTLRVPVVLDPAALKRQELTPESKVRLQLEGVRLKVALHLLLEQAGLTYRIVPEDNLLILTDTKGAEEPAERVFAELKDLHRDIHDLQDAVDELRQRILPAEPEAELRKPTIIEEVPQKKDGTPARTRPG